MCSNEADVYYSIILSLKDKVVDHLAEVVHSANTCIFVSSPSSRLYGHLGLGYGGGAVIQLLVDLVKLVLLSFQFVAIDVYNQVVEPFHLIFHLPSFTGRRLVV